MRFAYDQTYKQKQVVAVAPDFLVFINGDLTVPVCKKCGRRVNFNNDITDVSVSVSISGTGNASFSLATPRHSKNQYVIDGAPVFGPMSEVEIFMKGRFLVGSEPKYYPVFWGFIQSFSEEYSDGVHTLSVSCVDILRWWQIMVVNIQPSVISRSFNPREQISIGQTSRFRGMNPYSIIYNLAQDMGTLQHPDSINVGQEPSKRNEASIDKNMNTPEDSGRPGASEHKDRAEDAIFYWQKRFNQIGKAVRIFGMDGVLLTENDLALRAASKSLDQRGSQSSKFTSDKRISIQDWVKDISPFPDYKGTGGAVESSYRSKLDVAREVADFINFEFYMDVTGEIIFKPPFYNLDVRQNKILNIDDLDILNWSISENEEIVLTRCFVYGSKQPAMQMAKNVAPLGIANDQKLSRQYGVRQKSLNVNWLNDAESCCLYGFGWLDVNNAKRVTGSVTVIGRPELRLGYPIYLKSRDTFYYIKGIAHSLSVGGTFTTRIDFEGVRRKFTVPSIAAKSLTQSVKTLQEEALKASSVLNNPGTRNAVLVSDTNRPSRLVFKRDPVTGNAVPVIEEGLQTTSVEVVPQFTGVQQQGGSFVPVISLGFEANRRLGISDFGPSFGTYVYDTQSGVYQITIEQTSTPFDFPAGMPQQEVELRMSKAPPKDYKTTIPVTDDDGYDLIGVFPYGRNLLLTPSGKILFKPQVQEAFGAFTNAAFTNNIAGLIKGMADLQNAGVVPVLNIPMDKQKLGCNQLSQDDKLLMIKEATTKFYNSKDVGRKCGCWKSSDAYAGALFARLRLEESAGS